MIKQPPQDPPFGNQLRNYLAWVWPTELAWGELAVVHSLAVFSGQPIMQSDTVTHHPGSESPPEGGERVRIRPIATPLLSSGVGLRTERR